MTLYDNEPDADACSAGLIRWNDSADAPPENLRKVLDQAYELIQSSGWATTSYRPPGSGMTLAAALALQAAREVKTMTAHTMNTGELRAELQPVIFLHLLGPAETVAGPGETGNGTHVFDKGTLVTAQYWGNGQVMLTDTAGYHRMVKAHSVHAARARAVRDAPAE
jgi:hypothetical protein